MKQTKRVLAVLIAVMMLLAVVPVIETTAASNNWSWPTTSTTVTGSWPKYSNGSYHSGIDFGVSVGSPVYSTCDGEVVDIQSLTTSYGKHIKIRATVNGATVYMRYCHLSDFATSVGAKVSSGQLIGYSGQTGNATGPHLHYEVRNANDHYGNLSSPTLNPSLYLPGTSYTFETNDPDPPAFYWLDLNGWLDGAMSGDLGVYGTADVYINGNLVADDVNDFYSANGTFAHGTTYEIKDIKANNGYVYQGVYSGAKSGTLTDNTKVFLQFDYRPVTWWGVSNPDGYTGHDTSGNPTVSGTKRFWVNDYSKVKNRYAKIWIDNDVIADQVKSTTWNSNYFDCTIDTTTLSNGSHVFWLYLYENGTHVGTVQQNFTVNNPITWWGVSNQNSSGNYDQSQKPTITGVRRFWINNISAGDNSYVRFLIDDIVVVGEAPSVLWSDGKKYFNFTINSASLANGEHVLKAELYQNGQYSCTLQRSFIVTNDFAWWGVTDEDHTSHEDRSHRPVLTGTRMIWYSVPRTDESWTYNILIDNEKVVSEKNYLKEGWIAFTMDFSSLSNGTHTITVELNKPNGTQTITNSFVAKNDFAWWGLTDTDHATNSDQSISPVVTGTRMFWYHAPVNEQGWTYDILIDDAKVEEEHEYRGSGWISYTIDSTQLDNGTHTIALVASNGEETRRVDNTFYTVNHVHEYEATGFVAVTCETDGSVVYTCPCGDSYTETVNALGHNYGAWTKISDTQHQRVCSRDSSHVETADHTWNSGVETQTATCSVTGVKAYTCSVCNGTKTETININPNNHVNTTNVAATTSTCTVKGFSAGVYCNDCKKYISGHQEQPLAAHTITVINKRDATYDAEGYTGDDYCTVCKQTIKSGTAIPKLERPTQPDNPQQPDNPGGGNQQSGGCKWCGGTHGGAFGWLVRIFHNLFAAIFGARY